MFKPLLAVVAAAVLAGCTPAGKAAEAVIEQKVDAVIDETIHRVCNGPVDIAVRTFARHPALEGAIFELCPDTYGRIKSAALREQDIGPLVEGAVKKALATQ